jgi:hypothetical protein
MIKNLMNKLVPAPFGALNLKRCSLQYVFAKNSLLELLIDGSRGTPRVHYRGLDLDLFDFVDVDDFLVLDIENANYDYVKNIEDESDYKYANRLIAELVDNGLISENEALTTDPTELSDEFSQDYINLLTSEQIGDDNGVEYFIDNFGEDEFFKIVIDNNLIDFDNASKDAVNMDGIAHFLARYDGETIYLDNNVVAYRTN